MSSYRQDRRTPADKDWGKPQVNYPAGDPSFPQIIETKTARQSETVPAALSAHPDTTRYPSAFLTSLHTDAGGNRDTNWWLTYETLPGPIFVDVASFRETGVPVLTSTRKVAATANYTEGEFVPDVVNVSAIADNGDGTVTVTLSTNHDLPPRCWVNFSSTNSTPNINGQKRIISVPAENKVVISATITVAGTAAGTMQAINRISRELHKVPTNSSVLVKIDTMVAVPSTSALPTRNVSTIVDSGSGICTVTLAAAHGLVAGDWATFSGTNSVPKLDGPRKILTAPSSTTVTVEMVITSSGTAAGTMAPMGALARFNEDFKCWQDYDFHDFLNSIDAYFDTASTTGFSFNNHYSWGAGVGLPMQDGYHGPCRARRLRLFFVGPPPDSLETNLSPTFIMPSSGSFVIQGGSRSQIYTPDLINSTFSNSVSYRTGRIPHCLTGPSPAVTPHGSGQATVTLNLPESVPTHFTVGDIITLMGKPSKYDAGALWEVIVTLIYVPYTSGQVPP